MRKMETRGGGNSGDDETDRNYRGASFARHSEQRHGVGSIATSYASRMLACWMFFGALFMSNAFQATSVLGKDAWQRPGCHKVGHTRKISIPDCVEFHMTTNACRGFCESWAVPSGPKATPTQPVTSVGQCCNIMDTEPVEARVLCVDGVRTLTFKSAVSCSCYHCKKD